LKTFRENRKRAGSTADLIKANLIEVEEEEGDEEEMELL